jgi:2,4-dienoyl-CoA reductase-like NADH-dependent reductase (Old Yellow Enzyme family)/thioredoxin reductase
MERKGRMKGRLWQPIQIGQMQLKNRIVQPPMGTQYGQNGYVTERLKNYFEARAGGGAGLLIVELTCVHPRGRVLQNQLCISDDKFISGLKELAQVIHRNGAKAAIQLHHGGRIARSEDILMQPVAPSPLASLQYPHLRGEVPKELTIDEISAIVSCFAEAAVRAKRAGFDGVELHGAHGYLIDQFLSPTSNKRRDLYGGTLQKRARVLIEIIKAVKEKTGFGYPVWCRINGQEYGVEGGTSAEDAQRIARMAQEAGADAIHVTAVGPSSPINLTSPEFVPAVIADLAAGIRNVVNVPVIVVGKITAEAGEKVLSSGKADLVAVGRSVLADPEYWSKVASNRQEDIVPCILCMRCRDDVFSPTAGGIRCSVNAALGREAEYKIVTATRSRKVLVVGGGPAGMEAARVAALRGHRVTLWEKRSKLGGQLIQAVIPPHKNIIEPFKKYLEAQLRKLNVKIELGITAKAAMVMQFEPEVLVLATGATIFTPEIPGLNQVNAVQWIDILEGRAQAGDRVVLIGGGLVGCETADFLAEKGKRITVTNILPEMALGMGPGLRGPLLSRLSARGVSLLASVKYHEITPGGVLLTTKEGETKMIEADTIVITAGGICDRKLYEEIRVIVPETYFAGDCVEMRTIRDAIAEGYKIGLEI